MNTPTTAREIVREHAQYVRTVRDAKAALNTANDHVAALYAAALEALRQASVAPAGAGAQRRRAARW